MPRARRKAATEPQSAEAGPRGLPLVSVRLGPGREEWGPPTVILEADGRVLEPGTAYELEHDRQVARLLACGDLVAATDSTPTEEG